MTDGILLGTTSGPAGATPLTLTLTDSTAPTPQSVSTTLTLDVTAQLTASVQQFSTPKNAAASFSVSASGGTAPYSWTVAGGTLPTGLALSTTGAVSGTPSTAGVYPLIANVTDASGQLASGLVNITVYEPLSIPLGANSLPSGTVGVVYAAPVAVTGGVGLYSWAVAAGSLPPGLQLTANGALVGLPLTAGTYTFTLQVSSAAQHTTQQLQLTIAEPPSAVTISASGTALAAATAHTAYLATLSAIGGSSPYAWSVASGTLPPGVSLTVTGTLSGTPTTPGTFPFTLTVTDNLKKSASANYQILVRPALSADLQTLAPATAAQSYAAALSASGGTSPYTWTLGGTATPAGLILSHSGVLSWKSHNRRAHTPSRPRSPTARRPRHYPRHKTYALTVPRPR